MTSNPGMKDLIGLINGIQDAASAAGLSLGALDLPQIAVVGGQSAGKSSVLENFVGRDFLPRGSGIVTRRPLVLQLNPSEEEYAEFLHLPGKRFDDFNLVRQEIQAETTRLTGNGKAISRVPINLHVFSPNVLELTLVDLPGMTRVPVGDQPPDIENQLRAMILEYIYSDNTIILAVSPANQDLANSDALMLAAMVDPKGERTMGVITKLDLMDRGTDARDILQNQVYYLNRGYVGLVNRSQQDIEEGKDIKLAQKQETEYFLSHPCYRDMAERMGSKYLQQVLNKQLSDHIRKKLPMLSSDIKKQHASVKEELIELNAFNEESDEWKHAQLIKLLQQFTDDLTTTIEGHSIRMNTKGDNLSAGAKIYLCLYQDLSKLLDQTVNIDKKELVALMQNLKGFRKGLFNSNLAFDITVKKLVIKYKDPMINAVDIVSSIIASAVAECAKKLSEYPKLKDTVINILMQRLKRFEDKAKRHLSLHVDAHASFINYDHPEFQRRICTPVPPPAAVPIVPVVPVIPERKIESPLSPIPPKKELPTPLFLRRQPSTRGHEEVPAPQKSIGSSNEELCMDESGSTIAARALLNPGLSRSQSTVDLQHIRKPQQMLQKAWILVPGSFTRKSKDYWFCLAIDSLKWYKDENEQEMVGNISLEDLKLIKHAKSKKCAFVKIGKPINKEYSKIPLVFRSETAEEIWFNSCRRAGIGVDIANSSNQLAEDSCGDDDLTAFDALDILDESHEQQQAGSMEAVRRTFFAKPISDPQTNDGADMILRLVDAYMNIVDDIIRDMAPKYIVLFLINGILEFVRISLLAEVHKKEAWIELMVEATEEVERKKNLFKVYQATERAMDLLNIVSFS